MPEHTAAMRSLFESRARTHLYILRDPLLQLLTTLDLPGEDPKLRAFAASVRL